MFAGPRAPDYVGLESLVLERGGSLGKPLHVLDTTTSTSDEAKAAAKAGAPHGSTWVAEVQTAGRGRQGRSWISPRGEGLSFSVLLRIACNPSRLPTLAIAAGLATRDAIARMLPGVGVKLKWPNDVVAFVDGEPKKVAGVLVETSLSGTRVDALVVGIGVNVFTRVFPAPIAELATSLARLARGTSPELHRGRLLVDLLHELDRELELVAARGLGLLHARLVEADALRGRRVTSEAGAGVAEGIDVEGRLMVRDDEGGLRRWCSGEVHLSRETAPSGT